MKNNNITSNSYIVDFLICILMNFTQSSLTLLFFETVGFIEAKVTNLVYHRINFYFTISKLLGSFDS